MFGDSQTFLSHLQRLHGELKKVAMFPSHIQHRGSSHVATPAGSFRTELSHIQQHPCEASEGDDETANSM